MKSIGLKIWMSALAISVLLLSQLLRRANLAPISIKARIAAFKTTLAAKA